MAMVTIEDFLQDDDLDVTLTVLNKEAFTLSRDLLDDVQSYIDDRTAEQLHQAEYGAPFGIGMYDERRAAKAAMPPQAQPMAQSGAMSGSRPAEQSKPRKRKGLFQRLSSLGKKEANAALPEASEVSYNDRVEDLSIHSVPAAGNTAQPTASEEFNELYSLMLAKDDSPSLPDRMAHLGDTFQERLLHLIDEQDLTDPEVYKKANLDRKLFSKIRSNAEYRPKKTTVLALAIALELDLAQTKDLLARAGFAFSPSSKFDLIVQYCFEKRIYDIFEVNALLFQYDQPLLGAS